MANKNLIGGIDRRTLTGHELIHFAAAGEHLPTVIARGRGSKSRAEMEQEDEFVGNDANAGTQNAGADENVGADVNRGTQNRGANVNRGV